MVLLVYLKAAVIENVLMLLHDGVNYLRAINTHDKKFWCNKSVIG